MIKVCGMREPENIREIATLRVDMIGAIFFAKSPRFMGDRDDTADAFRLVPSSIKKVGVFVNASLEYLTEMKCRFQLDIFQLHGTESSEYCAEARLIAPVMKAFGLSESFDFSTLDSYHGIVEQFVFDTSTKDHGGSGRKFNWSILASYSGPTPFLLSGGIGPHDVDIINRFSHPFCSGLDLNSGFEISPALKNRAILGKFLSEIKSFR